MARVEDLEEFLSVNVMSARGRQIYRQRQNTTHFFFSSPLTNSTLCSTVSTALPASPIVITAGFLKYFLLSRSTGGGIVALNSVVTRVRPFLTIFASFSFPPLPPPWLLFQSACASGVVHLHLHAALLALEDLLGQALQDEGQVDLEAQVHHPVGLVHDDVAALGEDKDVPLDDVLETTGGRDDDFGAFAEVELLFFDGAL